MQQSGKTNATYVFPHYGPSEESHFRDRDPRFASNFSREMSILLGIKQNISSAYHLRLMAKREDQSILNRTYACTVALNQRTGHMATATQYTRNAWPNSSPKNPRTR